MSTPRRYVLVGAAVCAFIGLAWWLSGIWNPTPPRTLTMATGPEGSASVVLAERYRANLAKAGVTLKLRPTAGSVENVALLRDASSGVNVAFVQAGTTNETETPELVSLGTMLYEPLWLFFRGQDPAKGVAALAGKRLAIGPEGSGTRLLTMRLLTLNGLSERNATLLPFGPKEAADALAAGTVDFAAVVSSWQAPIVRRLIETPGVELASFPRADAYIARNSYLNKVVVPAGVADLERNIPPADVTLLAPKSSLVVRADLHPALQYLLLEAATEIHSPPGIFNRAGEFPAAESIDLPLAEGARHFYKTGRPFLQRHLPFWLASLAERLLIVLVPIVGILLPVLQVAPGLYVWNIRRKIFKGYLELKLVELEADTLPTGADATPLISRLDALESKVGHMKVPQFHAHTAYTFRHHVRLVRERLERRA